MDDGTRPVPRCRPGRRGAVRRRRTGTRPRLGCRRPPAPHRRSGGAPPRHRRRGRGAPRALPRPDRAPAVHGGGARRLRASRGLGSRRAVARLHGSLRSRGSAPCGGPSVPRVRRVLRGGPRDRPPRGLVCLRAARSRRPARLARTHRAAHHHRLPACAIHGARAGGVGRRRSRSASGRPLSPAPRSPRHRDGSAGRKPVDRVRVAISLLWPARASPKLGPPR